MKKFSKRTSQFLLTLILACLAMIFLFSPEHVAVGIKIGSQICLNSILPSLFPFFIVSNLWCSLGCAEALCSAAQPLMKKIFHIQGQGASAIILGLIGGYPTGAQTVTQLYGQGLISKQEAEHLLLFCNNAGPAFMISILGGQLFQSVQLGAQLYGIHLLSALMIGFLFRFRAKKETTSEVFSAAPKTAASFSAAFPAAVLQAGATVLKVFCFILFFSVVTQLIREAIPSKLQTMGFFSVLLGNLELAGGLHVLSSSSMALPAKLCAASFLTGWGGLCVHCQTLSFLSEHGLSSKEYFLGKLLHGSLAGLLTFLCLPFLAVQAACFTGVSQYMYYPVLQVGLLLLFLVCMLPFLKITSGNQARHRI